MVVIGLGLLMAAALLGWLALLAVSIVAVVATGTPAPTTRSDPNGPPPSAATAVDGPAPVRLS